MFWKQDSRTSISTAFSSSTKLSKAFFLFFRNPFRKKRTIFVSSLCSCHHNVNSSCQFCVSIEFYYKDTGVLLENIPLVKFIRNCIRDLSGVFSKSSPVKILMTSFPASSHVFVQTVKKFIYFFQAGTVTNPTI